MGRGVELVIYCADPTLALGHFFYNKKKGNPQEVMERVGKRVQTTFVPPPLLVAHLPFHFIFFGCCSLSYPQPKKRFC